MSYNFDPELASIIEFLPAEDGLIDIAGARKGMADMITMINADLDTSGVIVEDHTIPGYQRNDEVPVRVYTPANTDSPLPALIYIHGGGFILGDIETEHGMAIMLCRELGAVIVSVDYRLAPEHPFPAGLNDCYAGLIWANENAASLNIDPTRIAISGQSAGGGLSAALCLQARDLGGPAICFQLLGIPEVDDRLTTTSMQAYTDTPLWNLPKAKVSWQCYLGDKYTPGSDDVPYLAAPSRATDLSGLPPAYVTTQQFDPLRDEGMKYAMALAQAGIPTELHSYPGTFHGSTLVGTAEVSKREIADNIAAFKRAFGLG